MGHGDKAGKAGKARKRSEVKGNRTEVGGQRTEDRYSRVGAAF